MKSHCSILKYGIPCAAFLMLVPIPARAQWQVQVGAMEDIATAEKLRLSLNEQHSDLPVIVAHEEGCYKVRVGLFETRAEANLLKAELRQGNWPDAFVTGGNPQNKAVSAGRRFISPSLIDVNLLHGSEKGARHRELVPLVSPDEARSIRNSTASDTQLMAKIECLAREREKDEALLAIEAHRDRFRDSPRQARVEMFRGYVHLNAEETLAARDQWKRVIKDHSGSVEAGEASLRLGYLALKERASSTALEHFAAITRGEVEASMEHRWEATERIAAIVHKAGDIETAESIFAELEMATRDREQAERCRLQCAALQLEKARNGNATWDDVRSFCFQAWRDYQRPSDETAATLLLLELESYAYEENWDEVMRLASRHTSVHRGSPESSVAFLWEARALMETGRTEEARELLQILATNPEHDTSLRFRFLNVQDRAVYYLGTLK